jgi:3-(3-hydroxy-phenyl)propionate hydroxylase
VNRRLGENDYLLDHLGHGLNGLYFTEDGRVPDEHRQLLEELASGEIPFRCLVITRAACGTTPGRTLVDPDGSVLHAYGAVSGTFYLARPDRHIAARWRGLAPAEIRDALATLKGEDNR